MIYFEANLYDKAKERADGIKEWLRAEHPECREQKHLDAGTPERAYWHFGYMMALRDLLGKGVRLPKQ